MWAGCAHAACSTPFEGLGLRFEDEVQRKAPAQIEMFLGALLPLEFLKAVPGLYGLEGSAIGAA